MFLEFGPFKETDKRRSPRKSLSFHHVVCLCQTAFKLTVMLSAEVHAITSELYNIRVWPVTLSIHNILQRYTGKTIKAFIYILGITTWEILDKPNHTTSQYPVWYGSISPSISPSLLRTGTRNSHPIPCKGVKLGAFPSVLVPHTDLHTPGHVTSSHTALPTQRAENN